ncbi:MAG TPA: cytochrome P450 [Kineosporiaceae bacterium]|nr:cytochrome P450 [Kineosporiaceae bacterium]
MTGTLQRLPRRNARYTPLDADGPLPVDMLRDMPAIRRDPLAYLERTVARYGDLVAFPLPRTPVLLVNTPDGARRVLQDNHRGYGKRTVQYAALGLVTGAGLLTADGELWRRHRRVAQPAFHHGRLDAVAAAASRAGRVLRERWDAEGTLDVDRATLQTMIEVVGSTLFAADLSGSGERLVEAVDAALQVVVRRARSPLPAVLPRRLPTPSARRLRAATATLDAACADLVAHRRAAGLGEADADVLALLLRAADGLDGLDDREVRDELVTLVIAGHETVASCLTWTLHLLADHPGVQDRLAADLAEHPDGGPWTRAVVDEALRLYPPAWIVTRRALEAGVVAGVDVPAGTLVLVSPWLLHRRAADWPEPERFDPSRFLERRPPAGDYVPFGAGPRLCIGRDVALVQSVRILAELLRDRRVVRPAGAPAVRVDALVTLRPRGGLPLAIVPSTPGAPRPATC